MFVSAKLFFKIMTEKAEIGLILEDSAYTLEALKWIRYVSYILKKGEISGKSDLRDLYKIFLDNNFATKEQEYAKIHFPDLYKKPETASEQIILSEAGIKKAEGTDSEIGANAYIELSADGVYFCTDAFAHSLNPVNKECEKRPVIDLMKNGIPNPMESDVPIEDLEDVITFFERHQDVFFKSNSSFLPYFRVL